MEGDLHVIGGVQQLHQTTEEVSAPLGEPRHRRVQAAAHLLQVVGGDVVDRRLDVGLLQAAEAALQRSYEALPQVVHRADQLVGHRLVQTDHDQVLDLLDAGLDLFGCNRISVGRNDDVCE